MKLYGLANESHSALRMRGSQVIIVLANDEADARMKLRVYGYSAETLDMYDLVEVNIRIGDNPVNGFMY